MHEKEGCVPLNERTLNRIVNYLENTSESYAERDPYAGDPKARYSPATLVNEWYEDRLKNVVSSEPDSPMVSEYMDNYRKLCKYTSPDRENYFKMMFSGREGVGKQMLLDHLGLAYYNNYATTYDLCYNHLVKGICGPFPRKYSNGKYLPEKDLTLIYGNLTQWGIKEKVTPKPEEALTMPPPPLPEYKCEFVAYDPAEVKRLNDFPFRGKKKSNSESKC